MSETLTEQELERLRQLATLLPQNQEEEWETRLRQLSKQEATAVTTSAVEQAKKELIEEFGRYIGPMSREQAMSKFKQGLTPAESALVDEMLKDKLEKAPTAVFEAAHDPVTLKMVQDSARWQASQVQTQTPAPIQEEPKDVTQVNDKDAAIIERMLRAAEITPDPEVVNKLASEVKV